MMWEADPIKHLLEVIHIGNDKRESSNSQEFTSGKYSTNISLHLLKDDIELRVKPYTIEHLKQIIEEDYENGVVDELFVGIRDETSIAYVGKFWTLKEFNGKRVNQYFFQNDELSGYNFGHISGSEWPLNQPAVLDERLMQYFTALKDVRSDVTGSLDKCMEQLTRDGPEYTGTSDGSISFKLARR